MCDVVVIVLPSQDLSDDGGKNKELFFFISKKIELLTSTLINKNPNWSQSLYKGTGCV
jgi:hypothetical protein